MRPASGERLAETLGSLYAWGGEQSDIHNDRGGNYADDQVSGRMDCIDHSTSTTRLLHLLVRRGYLRAGIACWSRSRAILPVWCRCIGRR